MALGVAVLALAFAPAARVVGQTPADFPPALVTTSPPPAAVVLSNAPTLLEPQGAQPAATMPTITVPRPAPIEIPQAFAPASTAPELPTSDNLPHTTPAMPRVIPPQVLAPNVRQMTLQTAGHTTLPAAPPISGLPAVAAPATGVVTNPDGSLLVPMGYESTNLFQQGATNNWENKSPQINGVSYHW